MKNAKGILKTVPSVLLFFLCMSFLAGPALAVSLPSDSDILVDRLAPKVTITTPVESQIFNARIIAVTGIASDDRIVAYVRIRLNGGTWQNIPLRNLADEVTERLIQTWSATVTLASGINTIEAQAVDKANKYSPIVKRKITYDPTSPTVSIYSPSQGATITGTVRISARASDNLAVAGVQFLLDNQILGEGTLDPTGELAYSLFWDTLKVVNGQHTLVAIARDTVGNRTTSAAVLFRVLNDNEPPTVILTAPSSGATIFGTANITALATDNIGVTSVLLKMDGKDLGAGLKNYLGYYNFSWDTVTVSNGNHSLTAVAYDTIGNQSTSGAVQIRVLNDLASPQVVITSPVNGANVSGQVNITANATDDVGVTKVEFLVNGELRGTDTAAPYGYLWDTAGLVPGQYTLSAKAYDASGKTGNAASVTVNHPDTIAPMVSITAPNNDAAVSGTVRISAPASDNLAVAGVQFLLDNQILGEGTLDPTGELAYSLFWDTLKASNDSHILTAVARDAAGNSTISSPVNITVANVPVDTQSPVVTITSPQAGSTVSGTVAITATATDNAGITRVEFYQNNTLIGNDTSAPYSVSWNTTGLSGYYLLTARAFDAAGNNSSYGITVTVRETQVPTVTIISPVAGATISGTVNITANAYDNIGVARVQFRQDGINLGPEITASPYSYSWNTVTTSSGSHTLTALAYDAAGNVGQSTGVTVSVSNEGTVSKNINHDYPRIFVIQWGGGSDDWLSKFDMVIHIASNAELVRKARALNNNAYYLATSDWNAGGPIGNNASNPAPEGWYAHNSVGSRVEYDRYGLLDFTDYASSYTGVVNGISVSNEKYNQVIPRVLVDNNIDWTVFDGVWSDGTWPYPISNDVDLDHNDFNDWTEREKGDPWVVNAWWAGHNKIWTDLRNRFQQKFGSQKLIGFHVLSNPKIPPSTESIDGIMGADYINGIGSEEALYGNPPWCFSDFLTQMDVYENRGPKPEINYIIADTRMVYTNLYPMDAQVLHPFASTAYWTPPAGAPPATSMKSYYRVMRFMLGWALMRDVYFGMEDNEHFYYNYYDEYDVKLGYPKGPAQRIVKGNAEVYVRFFTNGAVVANPNNAEANTVTVYNSDISGLQGYDGPYYKFRGNQDPAWNDGQLFSSVTLRKDPMPRGWYKCSLNYGDAILLVKQQNTPVVSDIIVDNAYSGTSPGSQFATMSGFAWDRRASWSDTGQNNANPTWNVGPNSDNTADVVWHRAYIAPAGTGTATAVFRPTINVTGQYDVYEWHGWAGAYENEIVEATNVPVTIRHANGITARTINQQINSGQWNLIGRFNYAAGTDTSLTITNNANGYVIADAFMWKYIGPID